MFKPLLGGDIEFQSYELFRVILLPLEGYRWGIGVNTDFIAYVRTIMGRGARPCAPEDH
jgi:hypothetical protein